MFKNLNLEHSLKIKNFDFKIPILVGFLTFFFGFGAPAILNLYLLLNNSPLVLNFRPSLNYISAILGDGIILPIVNMLAISFLFKNQSLIDRLTVLLALFFGFLLTVYFHVVQATQGLVNWAMPSPWQWNFLGAWHAIYMLSVASLLSVYFLVLLKRVRQERQIGKEAFFVIAGIVVFFILLRFDYRGFI